MVARSDRIAKAGTTNDGMGATKLVQAPVLRGSFAAAPDDSREARHGGANTALGGTALARTPICAEQPSTRESWECTVYHRTLRSSISILSVPFFRIPGHACKTPLFLSDSSALEDTKAGRFVSCPQEAGWSGVGAGR